MDQAEEMFNLASQTLWACSYAYCALFYILLYVHHINECVEDAALCVLQNMLK